MKRTVVRAPFAVLPLAFVLVLVGCEPKDEASPAAAGPASTTASSVAASASASSASSAPHSTSPSARPSPPASVAPTRRASRHTIKFEVTSDGTIYKIGYTPSSNVETIFVDTVRSPWTITVGSDEKEPLPFLSAQTADSERVSGRIVVDGDVLCDNEGVGPYASILCSHTTYYR